MRHSFRGSIRGITRRVQGERRGGIGRLDPKFYAGVEGWSRKIEQFEETEGGDTSECVAIEGECGDGSMTWVNVHSDTHNEQVGVEVLEGMMEVDHQMAIGAEEGAGSSFS
jgi:hypothetical protein